MTPSETATDLASLESRIRALGRPPFVSWPRDANRAWAEASKAWEAANPELAEEYHRLVAQAEELSERLDRAAVARLSRRAAPRECECERLDETPALMAARAWAADGPQYLLLSGPPGTGKSVALRATLRRGGDAIVRAVDLVEIHLREPERMRRLARAWLLGIDDLGTEGAGELQHRALFDLLEDRHERGGRTALTTNLRPHELRDHIGPRLADRIRSSLSDVRLTGPSLRGKSP